jgi:type IV pilus assembly protein PilM
MKLPSRPLAQLETLTSPLLHSSFLGIDIGTSSLKIVQVSRENETVVLDTYGEIDLGPYDDHEARKAVHLDAPKQSAALLDLLHHVGASAHIGGIAIPLSSSLISFVKVPERDPEQMRRIVPLEAKQYVPVPIDQVVLDWLVVSDNTPKEDAFARAESKQSIQATLQELMLVAIEKKTAESYEATMTGAGLGASFYEVELFGAARACAASGGPPTLLIDLGASASKLCAINGRGIPAAVHPVPRGGQAITESIMQELGWDFEKAEDAKRAVGLGKSKFYSTAENAGITKTVRTALSEIFTEASRLIKEAANEHDVDIGRIVLLGGGASTPGIKEMAAEHFAKEVRLAEPFAPVRKPIILEDVLLEVGPKFAVAAGLALRGVDTSVAGRLAATRVFRAD